MGLFEKTRHVLAHELTRLLDPEANIDPERIKRLLLLLDEDRRQIAHSIARHEGELKRLLERTSRTEAEKARWEARLRLAREHARADLERAASERLETSETTLRTLREQAKLLGAALANLNVSRERVEQALRLVRRRRRNPAQPLQAQAIPEGTPLTAPETTAPVNDAAIEEAFVALELKEMERRLRTENDAAPSPPDSSTNTPER